MHLTMRANSGWSDVSQDNGQKRLIGRFRSGRVAQLLSQDKSAPWSMHHTMRANSGWSDG
jgi:hypothetical protein